jgi:propanol-preferring alcohol dehydrogenase
MQAMVLKAQARIETSPLHLHDVPTPTPAAGEVRVRVRCCAVCRTDLHIVEGDLPPQKLPVIPGHQVVGIIDAVGPNCRRLKVGQRIGIAWLRQTCGKCRFCKTGRENLCPNSLYTGYHADGGYAEYACVPEDFAYDLPEHSDDAHISPLLCAGIIGYRSFKRCNLRPKSKLALIGFGSSAHIIVQIALHRGHEIYVVSRSPNHQKLAAGMGAKWTGSDAAALPTKMDGAILFAPSGPLVLPTLESLDNGSVLALAGIHMSPIPAMDYRKYLYGERDIHPVTANTRQDGRELLAEAADAKAQPHITLYPLSEANQALQDMKADRVNGTAVLMVDSQASVRK